MKKTKKISNNFKKKIESFIITNNISQAKFAKKCNVTASIISKILSGNQTHISVKNYNNIKELLRRDSNNTANDNNESSNEEINIVDKANVLRRKYDVSISDMARMFDTDKKSIFDGYIIPDLQAKVLYYSENEDEFEKLAQEKRYMVSKFDKRKIVDKVKEFFDLGFDINQISSILHTSCNKVESIMNNDGSSFGYPSNAPGRNTFNDIINDVFELEISNDPDKQIFGGNYIDNIDKEQIEYHYSFDPFDRNPIRDEEPNDDIEYLDLDQKKEMIANKERTVQKLQNVIELIDNNILKLSEDNADRLLDIINIMIATDTIKIHIDIDL